jgi:hypothetical protein
MLTAIALVPSAPVVVPQLVGAAATEVADLRHAMCAAATGLPDRWVAVGVGRTDQIVGPSAAGSFAGYGVDIRVGLSQGANDFADLPLSALVTAWLRAEVRPQARAEVRVFERDHSATDAVQRGRDLRSTIDADDQPVGVLVVADGAFTLTPAAPGGHDPDSVALQAVLDDALAAGDVGPLTRLPEAIDGRVAWQVLAGLAGAGPRSVKELYRGAPYGVGYFAGVWLP